MMSTACVDTATAAARRRQRRLRSWLRHERMTVAMTLAEMMHHTAPRGPKMARVGEGVEHEQHDGLRAQKPPLPGVRPGSLLDPGRTVRHSAGEAPLLVVASLAGGDEVDATTVAFLLREHLKLRKKEKEEEERRQKREEAQHEARMRELDRRVWAGDQLNPAESYAWRKWAGHLPSGPRRKKKRKKKKLPRAPRPRQGCRRLCDHQRQVPAVRIPVMMQRQVPTVHSFMLPVQFLDMPVVVLRQVPGLMVQKTVDSPQLQSIAGRRHSLSFRRGRSPWSSLFSRPQRFPYCCSSGGRCPCYEGRAVSPVAENCGNSAVAVHGRRLLFRCAEAVPLGPGYSVDHRDFTVVRFQVVDAPVVQVVWFHRLFISVYSALLGSTADTSFVSVYGVFHIYVNWRITDPEVDSRLSGMRTLFYCPLCVVVTCSSLHEKYRLHTFREMTLGIVSVFCAELGLTADTCGASVWFSGDDFVFVSVFSWFFFGYIFGVSLRLLLEEFDFLRDGLPAWFTWKSVHYFNKQLL